MYTIWYSLPDPHLLNKPSNYVCFQYQDQRVAVFNIYADVEQALLEFTSVNSEGRGTVVLSRFLK